MMMIIPLMNLRVPGNAEAVFSVLSQLLSFDFFSTQSIPYYNDIFKFKKSEDTFNNDINGPSSVALELGDRFDQFGYSYSGIV